MRDAKLGHPILLVTEYPVVNSISIFTMVSFHDIKVSFHDNKRYQKVLSGGLKLIAQP